MSYAEWKARCARELRPLEPGGEKCWWCGARLCDWREAYGVTYRRSDGRKLMVPGVFCRGCCDSASAAAQYDAAAQQEAAAVDEQWTLKPS